jgi:CBS domain-containing protein
MRIKDVLRSKGHGVVTVTPGQTVLEAMRVLVQHGIGAVVVKAGEEVVGILSERDVLRLGARDPSLLSTSLVGEAMTPNPVVGLADDQLDYVMNVMTENRIRHLPVMEDTELQGIISIGDVVNACRTHAEAENRHLRDYIVGVVA